MSRHNPSYSYDSREDTPDPECPVCGGTGECKGKKYPIMSCLCRRITRLKRILKDYEDVLVSYANENNYETSVANDCIVSRINWTSAAEVLGKYVYVEK